MYYSLPVRRPPPVDKSKSNHHNKKKKPSSPSSSSSSSSSSASSSSSSSSSANTRPAGEALSGDPIIQDVTDTAPTSDIDRRVELTPENARSKVKMTNKGSDLFVYPASLDSMKSLSDKEIELYLKATTYEFAQVDDSCLVDYAPLGGWPSKFKEQYQKMVEDARTNPNAEWSSLNDVITEFMMNRLDELRIRGTRQKAILLTFQSMVEAKEEKGANAGMPVYHASQLRNFCVMTRNDLSWKIYQLKLNMDRAQPIAERLSASERMETPD